MLAMRSMTWKISTARALGSCVRNPLEAWVFACVFVFVLSCVCSGLTTAWYPVQRVIPIDSEIHVSEWILNGHKAEGLIHKKMTGIIKRTTFVGLGYRCRKKVGSVTSTRNVVYSVNQLEELHVDLFKVSWSRRHTVKVLVILVSFPLTLLYICFALYPSVVPPSIGTTAPSCQLI